MRVHLLTAVSRPENLGQLGKSIIDSAQEATKVEVCWHTRLDLEREHVGGQRLKNEMLDEVDDGWVVIIDDDTLMHERFLPAIYAAVLRQPEARAIIVSQRRTDQRVLRAASQNCVLGKIDAGQAALRRSLIGDQRIPETYAGDGIWLEQLLRNESEVVYLRDVLSLHNAISGVDVGPPVEA